MVSVLETTTVWEILQQCHKEVPADRQGTLLRGMRELESDLTVREAALKDEDDISLIWFDPFVEMTSWTSRTAHLTPLFVRIPQNTTRIEDRAFRGCKVLAKVVIPGFA